MSFDQYPIWDQEDLLGRMRGKADRVVKLVNLFLGDMPERIDSLNQEAGNQEFAALSATAHTVKGVAANLSVMRLQEAAAELEAAAKNQQADNLQPLLAAINEIYAESESELTAFVAANS
ncbi:MAG: Hpt domain-containing protein [Pseudomonadales bacterium]|jgi:HPt (histidine-containing phosphotransfer) domain-containing protein